MLFGFAIFFFFFDLSLKCFEEVNLVDQRDPSKIYFQTLLGKVYSAPAKAWMAFLGSLLNTLGVHKALLL